MAPGIRSTAGEAISSVDQVINNDINNCPDLVQALHRQGKGEGGVMEIPDFEK